ncbi:hypothetical protein CRG98_012084 [Punica granatum]|uniref:Uncharacterized protein n=1 Tax=Punica granatum TaxID=22663 RepID=A0A2I0KGR8_PUNGR|nr:hypothetical protein CRG98_012084 [Punica granatum]
MGGLGQGVAAHDLLWVPWVVRPVSGYAFPLKGILLCGMLALLLKQLCFAGGRLCCLGGHALTCGKFAESQRLVLRYSSSREEHLRTPLGRGSESVAVPNCLDGMLGCPLCLRKVPSWTVEWCWRADRLWSVLCLVSLFETPRLCIAEAALGVCDQGCPGACCGRCPFLLRMTGSVPVSFVGMTHYGNLRANFNQGCPSVRRLPRLCCRELQPVMSQLRASWRVHAIEAVECSRKTVMSMLSDLLNCLRLQLRRGYLIVGHLPRRSIRKGSETSSRGSVNSRIALCLWPMCPYEG